ncbi:MAG: HAD family hydrolase [Anaerolineae bacterium]
MVQIAAVFFDLGDTLVDLGEGRGDYEARLLARAAHVYDALAALGAAVGNRERFAAALAHESEALYHAALAEQRGIDIYEVMRRFLPQMGIPAEESWVRAAGEAFYTHNEGGAGLRPGARDLLAALQARGYRLGVISNTLQPGPIMDRTLSGRRLFDFFSVRVYSSVVGVAKPHPLIFRTALEALGVPAGQAVYVGDRLRTDVAGAQAVGMKAVLIEVAHRIEEDPAIRPDARIRELPELLDVLPQLE